VISYNLDSVQEFKTLTNGASAESVAALVRFWSRRGRVPTIFTAPRLAITVIRI
jgi:hypothetical protein